MDLQCAVNEFVTQGRDLCQRLQSFEQGTLSGTDLHILRVQLHLLDTEAATLQDLLFSRSKGVDGDDLALDRPRKFTGL